MFQQELCFNKAWGGTNWVTGPDHSSDFFMTFPNQGFMVTLPDPWNPWKPWNLWGMSCDRGVHVDVHVGMWHDFPMYSEGCGSGEGLWQAALALNRVLALARQYTGVPKNNGAMSNELIYKPMSVLIFFFSGKFCSISNFVPSNMTANPPSKNNPYCFSSWYDTNKIKLQRQKIQLFSLLCQRTPT